MGHSYRFAQAEDSVSFAGFLSPDLSPPFLRPWSWGNILGRRSGQQDGSCAPVYATSCPVGPVPALLAAVPEASIPETMSQFP